MKITQTVALLAALILAAGCAHEEHGAQYDESVAPGANATGQYNQNNNNQYGTYQNDNRAKNRSESDRALVAQLRQALQQDSRIAPLLPNIQISANNGTVILSGSVQSAEQKQQIESIVLGAADIEVLDNQLLVSGAMNPTSRSNAGGSIYSNGKMNDGQESNQPASSTTSGGDNNVAPSGGTNSMPRIYHDSAGSMNAATNNALSPTSRTNGESQIYQQNENQNPQGANTNGDNKIP